VEGRNNTLLALEKVLIPTTRRPPPPKVDHGDQRLHIAVIFTSMESTVAALRRAGALAASLNARITLLVFQLVPFPLPLESPPVLLDWNERRFQAIATESRVETTVQLYLCRDRIETLPSALGSNSVVIIGAGKSPWPFTREKRLARQLRHRGHEVIFIETE
jgi:hypothetical protein